MSFATPTYNPSIYTWQSQYIHTYVHTHTHTHTHTALHSLEYLHTLLKTNKVGLMTHRHVPHMHSTQLILLQNIVMEMIHVGGGASHPPNATLTLPSTPEDNGTRFNPLKACLSLGNGAFDHQQLMEANVDWKSVLK